MKETDKLQIRSHIAHLRLRRVQYGIFSFILVLSSLTYIGAGEINIEGYILFLLTGFILGLFTNTWFKLKDELEKLKKN